LIRKFRLRNGIWYYIEYSKKPDKHTKWDDVRYVRATNPTDPFDSKKVVYYIVLRQLSSKELRRHSLQNG